MAEVSGIEFQFDGKSYTLPAINQDGKRAFGLWAKARALKETAELQESVRAGELPQEEYGRAYSLTHQRVTAGYFGYDEPGGQQALYTRDGLVRAAWLAMKRWNADVREAEVRAMLDAETSATPEAETLRRRYEDANDHPTAPQSAG